MSPKNLSLSFYSRLFALDDLPTAIRNARQELFNGKGRRAYYNQTIDLEDWILPVVYQNQVPRLSLREFTPDEQIAYFQRNAGRYPAPKTSNVLLDHTFRSLGNGFSGIV